MSPLVPIHRFLSFPAFPPFPGFPPIHPFLPNPPNSRFPPYLPMPTNHPIAPITPIPTNHPIQPFPTFLQIPPIQPFIPNPPLADRGGMETIAITNQKGGVGKTTSTVNLAAALAEKKNKVLVIDLDGQQSATHWLGSTSQGRGVASLFTGEAALDDLVEEANVPGVDLVPASPWLVGIDRAMAGEVGAETILRSALEQVPSGRWTHCLIDCPPALTLVSVAALVAADRVIVPVEASYLALSGLAQLVRTIEQVKERLNPQLELSAILPCKVDMRTRLSRDVLAELRKHFKGVVLKSIIRNNVRITEAPSQQLPVTLSAPKSPGAKDYRAAAKELLQRKAA